MKREKLGEILVRMGVLDDWRLRTALAEQKKWGGGLGNTLLRLQYVSREHLLAALAAQQGVPNVDLDGVVPDPEALQCINWHCARLRHVVPLRLEGARKEILVC